MHTGMYIIILIQVSFYFVIMVALPSNGVLEDKTLAIFDLER